jgi:hypothetical protein
VKDFGAVGDGVADDTAEVQAAVTHCYTTGAQLYWPDGSYLTTSSISNFHAVESNGSGVAQRGADTYAVIPNDNQTNILYVSATGVVGNDGLSQSQPTTVTQAFNILKSFGAKTLNGTWRIQFLAGTYTDTGLVLEALPYFKNKLQIFGANVDETSSAIPTTVWNGTANARTYAIRIDVSIFPSALINLFIKNIKFENWSAGAAVIWAYGNTLIHNVHVDNCPIGLWMRHGYFKVWYGVYNDCSTWGVGIQYNGTANIGSSIAGTGLTISNCGDGVQVGRFAVAYVESCTFTSCAISIECEWSARVRPLGNTFNAPTEATFTLRGNSLVTTGPGENTLPTLTEASPYTRSQSGSVNPSISRYGQKCLHNYAGVELERGVTPITVFSVATTSQILLSDSAYGGSDFVPFRLPAYALYSPTFELEMELGIALNVNAGGTLEFHGQGNTASTKICEIVIPTAATFRSGFLKMRVTNTPNSSTARFEFFFPITGQYTNGNTVGLSSTAIRESNDNTLLFRLYWTSATVDQVQFFNMRTYVVE